MKADAVNVLRPTATDPVFVVQARCGTSTIQMRVDPAAYRARNRPPQLIHDSFNIRGVEVTEEQLRDVNRQLGE